MHEISQFAISVSTQENVPERLSLTAIHLAADVPGLPPQPFVGPQPEDASGGSAGDSAGLALPGGSVQGSRILSQLALLPIDQIDQFVRDNPGAIAELVANPPQSRDVAVWWASMRNDSRAALRGAAPGLIGNLDGIPYSTRDMANRSVLTSTMRDLETTIATQLGRASAEKAKLQLAMLQSISNALVSSPAGKASGTVTRTLLSLDATGQGKAAIVIGDLSSASYVTYMVPGMFFTIEGQMVYWTDAAARLRDEQLSWLARYGDTTGTVATVAWIGYHTPNLTNVGSLDNAKEARDSLAYSIEGLQTLRSGNEPYVTVIGHSYGSTAALMALTEYDFEVDALALVGSPGSAAQSVKQLHVKNGNVYVGKAQWDPVPNSAFFGSEPGSEDYGARTFGTDGGTDPITGATMLRSFFHIEYFSPGTESLRNLALIGIGHGADITVQ